MCKAKTQAEYITLNKCIFELKVYVLVVLRYMNSVVVRILDTRFS